MITLTMLLTTVAFKNYVSSHLPNVNFVTWIDAYVLCCIFVILIVGLENMYMSHYLEYTGDDDGPETSPPAWWAWWHLDAEHANNIDTFAIFTTCWVCFHLGVIPLALHWHIKATRRVDKDWWSDMAVGDAVEAKRTNKGEGEGEGEAKAKGKSMGEGKGKVGQQRWVEWWDIGTIDRVNEDGTYDVVFTNHKHCPKETKNRSEVRLATAQGVRESIEAARTTGVQKAAATCCPPLAYLVGFALFVGSTIPVAMVGTWIGNLLGPNDGTEVEVRWEWPVSVGLVIVVHGHIIILLNDTARIAWWSRFFSHCLKLLRKCNPKKTKALDDVSISSDPHDVNPLSNAGSSKAAV
jgi:hypothetical protein